MEKILVLIDDDHVGNMVNEKMLKKYYPNHTTKIFVNPEEALEYFSSLTNVVLGFNEFTMFLDFNMPSLTGFQFLEELEELQCSLDDSINLQVYLLTSENSVFVKEKIKVFPMIKRFIEKPLTLQKISRNIA